MQKPREMIDQRPMGIASFIPRGAACDRWPDLGGLAHDAHLQMSLSVTDLPSKKHREQKPPHWADIKASAFINPWDSWHQYSAASRIVPYTLFNVKHMTYPDPNKVNLPSVQPPNWDDYQRVDMKDKIKSTWLGHASFMVELPAKPSEPRGVRMLFDPIFSDRCSSSQFLGPKRYTPAPCKQVPDVDIVLISHNHYDHLDVDTLRDIFQGPRKPHVFAPLGNRSLLQKAGAPDSHIHDMDWWQSKRVDISLSQPAPVTLSCLITCTPCQHFTGRLLFDDYKTLWSSWVVESSPSAPHANGEGNGRGGVKVYFAGDTGYRSVPDGSDEDKVPKCPAFKDIGDVFGGFDFAMIPIGAYMPRQVMSPIHCAPQDSVCIFKDIKARKALGMHWG
ncbi:hypothetical protein AX15_007029, partial [Amanita polypyramis BW_CC]